MAAGVPGGNVQVGLVSASGLYTAPANIPSGGLVSVSATSLSNGTTSTSAQVQIVEGPEGVSVSVSPGQVSLGPGQSQQFSATVSGSGNNGVTWAANGVVGGNASVGTISQSGLYTAPSVTGSATITITARSESDANSFANATALISSGQGGTAGCGPPGYGCARTDLAISTITSLPNWGGSTGANRLFTDSTFNPANPVQYVRVTDINSIPAHPNDQFVADVAGSGDENHFNIDDTLFTIGDGGGNTYFFGLDPQTMATGLMWDNAGGLAAAGAFSQSNPNQYYSFQTNGRIKTFDFTGCAIGNCTPAETKLYDFVASCGVTGLLQWSAIGGIGGNDNIFSASYSPGIQDTATQVVAWNRTTGNCYLYDTAAGTVTQYPGATPLGNISAPDRYTVHNLKMDPSGTWLVVITGECITGSCLAHAWQIGTTTVKVCALACGGHFTETAAGWINNSSRPGDVYLQTQMLFRAWTNFDTTSNSDLTPLATARPQISLLFDSHPSAKNDPLGTHAYPVFNCIYSPVTEIDEPWTSEIIAYSQVPGAVYRFGHSFNSNFESSFQSRECIGAASSTGNFYAFATDGEGSFGSTVGGGATCLLGGPPPANNQQYGLNELITIGTGTDDVFKVTVAGTTDSSTPTWPSQTGASVTWGTATFTNQGPSTCRSDVLIVRAQ
jgi:hypothetical protein